ncbi:translation initiation factor 4E [Pancytospora epiphaga]|nr:translation initiation factor 4E [Pancytospora epiphaga]
MCVVHLSLSFSKSENFVPMSELASEWRYYQVAGSEQNQRNWADLLKMVGKVSTAPELLFTLDKTEEYGIENVADLNLFKGGILPMWEDKANINGGRCILEVPTAHKDALNTVWRNTVKLCCSNVVESINGCVFNEKTYYRISIWIADPRDSDQIIKAWKDVLKCGEQFIFSFAMHNKYTDYSKNRKKNSFRK